MKALFPVLVALALPALAEVIPDAQGALVTQGDRTLYVREGKVLWERKLGGGHLEKSWLLGKDQVQKIDLPSGKTLWKAEVKGPWFGPELHESNLLIGDEAGLRALDADSGVPRWTLPCAGKNAVPLQDGSLLVQTQDGLLRVTKAGVLTWMLTTGREAGKPQVNPEQSKLALTLANPSRTEVIDLGNGEVLQQIALPPGKPEPPEWPEPATLVDQPSGDVLSTPLGTVPLGAQIVKLDATHDRLFSANATRTLDGPWQPLPGEPVFHQGSIIFCRLVRSEPELERGRPVLDLLTGQPRQRSVEGYAIWRDLKVVEQDPDAALISPVREVGGRPIYAVKKPGEDPVLRQLGGWKSQLPFEADWAVAGKNILLRVGSTLVTLDAGTGQTRWTSPPLKLGEGTPTLAENGMVQGDNTLYQLDPQGQVQWQLDLREGFLWERLNHLICLAALCLAIGGFILAARRRDLFIRRLAGINAIDEAVGRATEMGKPVLYIPGLEDIDETQTMASLSILSHVARRTAEYDSSILVPTRRSVVMSTAQEVVKDAYTVAGRPDSYVSDNIRYLTDDQFGYVVGVDGMMLRERPAANFYLGYFYSESLILAETGYGTGAIQIAGTAVASQLPFFVVACDYTLIGEELYAASAYLSRDPMQVGSLRGQDAGKALVMLAILLGSLALSCGFDFIKVWFHA